MSVLVINPYLFAGGGGGTPVTFDANTVFAVIGNDKFQAAQVFAVVGNDKFQSTQVYAVVTP